MTEMAKTLTFVAVAVLSLGAAFMARPGAEDFDVQSTVGEKLNQFDVDDAKRLRIVTFDAETASTREFEVAEENGLWVIPSKHGYPADAVKQMGAAANCLIDREVLRVAAESASDHADLGLVDPTSSKLDSNAAGVGIRVTMTDIDGNSLADMIIGKKVPDTTDQYYVRNADQDVAYVVSLHPEHLTTQFQDWLEKDLLGINPLDVRRVAINDYTAEFLLTMQGPAVKLDRRTEMVLNYNQAEGTWEAERLQQFDKGKKALVDFTLAEDQEFNEEALRELRYGLDDLSIVDVERKPTGLSADLKAGDDFKDQEALESLFMRGFGPVAGKDGQMDILSSEGEVICTLADGVEYVLRFGNLQMESDADQGGSPTGEAADPNSADDDGIHRYLFVMARYNEDMVPPPELAELPELPAESADDAPAAADSTATEDKAAETDDQTDEAPAAGDESEQADAETGTGEQAQEEKPDLDAIIAARKLIEEENQRLLDEYQQQRDAAQLRVKELNERFGDWYYVIDNKVFKQIHLGRDAIVKAKDKAEESAAEEGAAPAGLPAGLPGLPGLPPGQ